MKGESEEERRGEKKETESPIRSTAELIEMNRGPDVQNWVLLTVCERERHRGVSHTFCA